MSNLPLAKHYIDGVWLEGNAAPQQSLNPANAEVLGSYSPGSAALTNDAIKAARVAFDLGVWAASPKQRSAALLELADQLEAAKTEMAELIVAENGKLRAEADGEMMVSVSEARYYAGLARNIFGRSYESAPGNISLLHSEPAGVAGIIVPWNAPVTILVRSLAPALAAGCTTIIKPAPQTPLIHARFMECIANCPSIPKGVVNSVNENGTEVGETLARSEEVDVISFTGSSQTGKLIMAAAAPTLKRLSLELGGKAPSLIFPDADLDKTVNELTKGALVMAGQICVGATRFLVHESVRADFRDRIRASFAKVKTGPGNLPSSQMGALIDKGNQARVLALIEQAGDEGELVLKGTALGNEFADGAFVTPTLFEIDDINSSLVQEEMFAPIASIETFSDEAEAVQMANATRYGLAASLFTQDLSRAHRVARAIRSGTVWINSHTRLFPEIETGGYKQSGLGRLHGVEGLNDFLETKHVYFEAGTI